MKGLAYLYKHDLRLRELSDTEQKRGPRVGKVLTGHYSCTSGTLRSSVNDAWLKEKLVCREMKKRI